jgi:N-6 DNA Methylase
MNLMIMHGIKEPNIVQSIETVIQDIKENLKFDIIMTNPPFEGEESDNIKRKLPASYQTRDTALANLPPYPFTQRTSQIGQVIGQGFTTEQNTIMEKVKPYAYVHSFLDPHGHIDLEGIKNTFKRGGKDLP